MKYDISIMTIAASGVLTHEITPSGRRNAGTNKILEIWLKKFIGNDCGNIISLLGDTGSKDFIELRIMTGVINANEFIKNMQSIGNIPDDEMFDTCKIKNLDIGSRNTALSIQVEFRMLNGNAVMINI